MIKGIRFVLVCIAFSLPMVAGHGCATSPEPGAASDDSRLGQLSEWLSGRFSSAQQAAENPRYYEIHLRATPIWTIRSDAIWLYVEQAASDSLDRPYRQRVYRLSERVDGKYESEVYTLPGDPLEFAGAWRTPEESFSSLSPSDLELREGCTIELEWDEERDVFVGSTIGMGCSSSLGGASYASSQVTLSADEMRSWDRGFDADGRQVWGAEAGPYVFRRID